MTLPHTLADALYAARRPSEAAARPVPAESYGRPNRASWHVVAYRWGVARVVESRGTRGEAEARLRQLAAGGLECDRLAVERDGGGAVLRLAPRAGKGESP